MTFDLAIFFLFGHDTKSRATKGKSRLNWGSSKLKRTLSKEWKEWEKWEKIFTNHISDKELISIMCKEIQLNSNNKATNILNEQCTWIAISLEKIYK